MAKFRKVDPRIWNDEKFQTLPPSDKLVAIYCLTGQVNRIGIFKFSVALASEDLGIPVDEIRERLERVCHTLNWPYDKSRRVLYFPNWWKYNNPGSEKTLAGILSDLHDVPQTPLVKEFTENTQHLGESLCHTLSAFVRKGMPYQEQEQEQEKEQDIASYEACPEAASVPSERIFECKRSKGSSATSWALPLAELETYVEVYGRDLDVPKELARARSWLHTNASKRKTAGGMLGFLTRWLNRAANDSRGKPTGSDEIASFRAARTPEAVAKVRF